MRMNVPHGMEETRHLLLSRSNYARICMPGCGDTKRCRQIQVTFPFCVPHMHSLSSLPDDGPSAFRIEISDIPRFKFAEEFKNLF